MSKIAPFPHRYTVALDDGRLAAPPRSSIEVGPPPQFGGTDQRWSPEELLVGATLECLWTTFEAFARRDGLVVHRWSGDGTGILDRGAGGPTFTAIELDVEMVVDPVDDTRARTILATAERNCIISHALACPVTVKLTIAHELRAAGA